MSLEISAFCKSMEDTYSLYTIGGGVKNLTLPKRQRHSHLNSICSVKEIYTAFDKGEIYA